jgi:hypothetical protein
VAGDHLVQDCAQRKDVGSRVGRKAFHLFGRHVADRSHDDARLGRGCGGLRLRHWSAGRLRVRQLRQAEIQDLDAAVTGHEQVLRLEVPVHDAFLVRRREPLDSLRSPLGLGRQLGD